MRIWEGFVKPLVVWSVLCAMPLAVGAQQPLLRMGADDSPHGELFTSIVDVALDPFDRVIVLDGGEKQALVFGRDGRLRQRLGRVGAGPGEFTAPAAMTLTQANRLLIADAATSRITEYDVSRTDSVRFVRTWPVSLRINDLCSGGGRVFALADNGAHLIHEVAFDGRDARIVGSFGPYKSLHRNSATPQLRMLMGLGSLACAPGGEVVALAPAQLGEVRVFSAAGQELAHRLLIPFATIGLELNNGGVRYIWPPDGVINQVSSVRVSRTADVEVGVTAIRRGPEGSVTLRYERRSVARDGTQSTTANGRARFVENSERLVACIRNDPVPELWVFASTVAAAPCR